MYVLMLRVLTVSTAAQFSGRTLPTIAKAISRALCVDTCAYVCIYYMFQLVQCAHRCLRASCTGDIVLHVPKANMYTMNVECDTAHI